MLNARRSNRGDEKIAVCMCGELEPQSDSRSVCADPRRRKHRSLQRRLTAVGRGESESDRSDARGRVRSVEAQVEIDFVATMGCGDACPFVDAKQRENWQIPDPKNLPTVGFNEVRDLIEQ